MNKLLILTCAAAIGLAASASAATLNLSTVTTDTTIPNGTTVVDALGSNVKLSIAAGATITLRAAQIHGEGYTNYAWAGLTCLGDATIILEGNQNEIVGFSIYYPGIYVPAGCTLTIKGSGNLAVQSNGKGAGIGSGNINAGDCTACGNIVIEGGTIVARSPDAGAGIGSGSGGSSCGNIMILGGTITARCGGAGAGIGSGANGSSCGSIAIVGGTVQATGSGGIGSGSGRSSCGDILIGSGVSSVYADGESGADNIGAGFQGSTCGTVAIAKDLMCVGGVKSDSSTINIRHVSGVQNDISLANGSVLTGTLAANVKVSIGDNATVTLRDATINGVNNSSYKWAGLTCLGNATIILEGANTVKGFYDEYPGIYVPANKTLTIRGDGSLDASSNNWGAGIGGGFACDCGNIVIQGGVITARGGNGAAGIGGGYNKTCGDIYIEGGTVNATGGNNGASGIGSGGYGNCGNITITKGVTSVTATKDEGSTNSIGNGNTGICGTVMIGGVVTGAITASPYTYHGQVVDLSGLSGAYTAQDGDTLKGTTAYAVTIPAGATVTVNGVSIMGAAGGTVLPTPAFSAGGKAATTEFVQGAGGKWTLTTFAELGNDALGADVANSQIKVYSASTVEGLESASPMSSGVEVKEKKSAVKTTIEVTPPSGASQFFKVKFGE